MKLTEERLVKMILEELDAVNEVFRAKGESDEEYAKRRKEAERMKAARQQPVIPPEKGTEAEEAKKALAFQVNPIVMLLKQGAIKGLLEVPQETYNAIQGREDLTDEQKAHVILGED
jgi:SpoVK/Ycf46/Vps4 family AAA+-type ATPase